MAMPGVGQLVNISIGFTSPVSVTGSSPPAILLSNSTYALTTNSPPAILASYIAGNNTSTLVFQYSINVYSSFNNVWYTPLAWVTSVGSPVTDTCTFRNAAVVADSLLTQVSAVDGTSSLTCSPNVLVPGGNTTCFITARAQNRVVYSHASAFTPSVNPAFDWWTFSALSAAFSTSFSFVLTASSSATAGVYSLTDGVSPIQTIVVMAGGAPDSFSWSTCNV
eukprot:TRINITY_DN7581_c0_g1_i12.p1 TRINITY_DN7581_c0_g1~~TRINITY_DN7581_c0_g1_i12.p1  ORF type:complete len:222 (-),score=67.43 TRINITY_DN7581_c0_g1_i12:40-705(-)